MTDYVSTAPAKLIQWHQLKTVAKGYKELTLLLTDSRMELAWREIKRRQKNPDYDERLFAEIVLVLQNSRRRRSGQQTELLRRSEVRDKYQKLTRTVDSLIGGIENTAQDSMAYAYFPDEVMRNNGIENWQELDDLCRAAEAGKLLVSWPSLVEMLLCLKKDFIREAEEAMTKPRVVKRKTTDENFRKQYFIRSLGRYFKREYGTVMYGTLARIAEVLLDTDYDNQGIRTKTRGGAKRGK